MIVKHWLKAFLCLFVLLVLATSAMAQKNDDSGDGGQAEDEDILQYLTGANWLEGPGLGRLGSEAEVKIPEGFVFTDGPGTQYMMEVTENMISDQEMGFIAPRSFDWFITFEYDPSGHVKDDERIDADALMKSMMENNRYENEERRRLNWPELRLMGWYKEPYYDSRTKNLQWSVKLESEGHVSINHNIRLLGREGVMAVTIVAGPEDFDQAVAISQDLLDDFTYVPGRTYTEYRKGDKLAEYGLAGLALGGAVAVAAKSGILKHLVKIIVVAVAAVGGLFAKIFGRKKKDDFNGQV